MNRARSLSLPSVLVLVLAFLSGSAKAANPHWVKVSSSHFSVLTDGGQKKGEMVVLRFEQMRTVFGQLLARTRLNMPEPLEIIALKDDGYYSKISPARTGSSTGFFLPGEDRNYIVLDLADSESWRTVTHEFAHLMLNYNYPQTPGWFDEGFAEYFSSIQLTDRQAQVGADPERSSGVSEDVLGRQTQVRNPPKSLVELLSVPVWISIPDLFTMRRTEAYPEGTHHTLFHAESWIVLHYLLDQNKLGETGTYFNLVQNQKVPVEQAMQQAYGMSPARFEQALKSYFQSIAPMLQVQGGTQQSSAGTAGPLHVISATGDNVGSSTHEMSGPEARALVAEMAARMPEHREQAVRDLEAILTEPKVVSTIPHRALAWVQMQKKDFPGATEELGKAMEIDTKDLWVRYYLALVKYHAAQTSGAELQGLGNMMQDLRAVLDIYPDFAQAYYLLALARLEGGGVNSAIESIKAAIQLNPRDETYVLELAQIYLAGKHWDAATEILERLAGSQNLQVAHAARNSLDDLPTLKKYGRLPQAAPVIAPVAPKPEPQVEADDEQAPEQRPQAPPQPDKRPVQFAKGKMVKVDCGQPPAAVLTVVVNRKTLKLRTENYKSLLLIGGDDFSCDWVDRPVSVNFKAGGRADGDLVSLEVQ
jgi:tetratricopeptide (TPR) repeat protein